MIVRSTNTLNPTEDAQVVAEKQGNSIYLDFFIPRGIDGVPQNIVAGTTTSLASSEQANVKDRFENDIHYLDFEIPKGEKGETGPRGFPGEIGISEVITIDGTETLDAGENAEVQDDKLGTVHHLTFYIPKGEKGDIGPEGPAGPSGLTPDINATIFNPNTQTVTNRGTLSMPQVHQNSGFIMQDSTMTATTTGTFLVSFFINSSQDATDGDYVAIAINGNMIDASKRPLSSTNTGATFVTLLNRGDIITLVANVGGTRNINASGSPSATLSLMMISY